MVLAAYVYQHCTCSYVSFYKTHNVIKLNHYSLVVCLYDFTNNVLRFYSTARKATEGGSVNKKILHHLSLMQMIFYMTTPPMDHCTILTLYPVWKKHQ